jgi:hypothetical protein
MWGIMPNWLILGEIVLMFMDGARLVLQVLVGVCLLMRFADLAFGVLTISVMVNILWVYSVSHYAINWHGERR